VDVSKKLDLIRVAGNKEVHEPKPIKPQIAVAGLGQLVHVIIGAGFRSSAHPEAVPTQDQTLPPGSSYHRHDPMYLPNCICGEISRSTRHLIIDTSTLTCTNVGREGLEPST
jgi:hypothetical protein